MVQVQIGKNIWHRMAYQKIISAPSADRSVPSSDNGSDVTSSRVPAVLKFWIWRVSRASSLDDMDLVALKRPQFP